MFVVHSMSYYPRFIGDWSDNIERVHSLLAMLLNNNMAASRGARDIIVDARHMKIGPCNVMDSGAYLISFKSFLIMIEFSITYIISFQCRGVACT